MELAIKILESMIVVGLAFCLFVVVFLAKDLSRITENMIDEVEDLKKKQVQKSDNEAQLEVRKEFARNLAKELAKRSADRIHVEDGEPLDFPNEK